LDKLILIYPEIRINIVLTKKAKIAPKIIIKGLLGSDFNSGAIGGSMILKI
tara:strand:- start:8 stop:160 length:153 start_codon:yes stop_codon:yes gene_type:complete